MPPCCFLIAVHVVMFLSTNPVHELYSPKHEIRSCLHSHRSSCILHGAPFGDQLFAATSRHQLCVLCLINFCICRECALMCYILYRSDPPWVSTLFRPISPAQQLHPWSPYCPLCLGFRVLSLPVRSFALSCGSTLLAGPTLSGFSTNHIASRIPSPS